jgi:hypothetical protein
MYRTSKEKSYLKIKQRKVELRKTESQSPDDIIQILESVMPTTQT